MPEIISINNDHEIFSNTLVFRTKDQWGDIMVIDKKKCRVLAFDPVYEQSSIDLKNPQIPVHEYTQIMLLVLAFINPRHITILGLGGGSLLHSLHYLLPQCTMLTFELRAKVYEVALDFFLIPTTTNINIMISDAKLAIRRCPDQSTQIIFADMYQSYGMNPFQMQKQFIKQCHRILDDAGWLVINYHKLPELNLSFIHYLQRNFADVFVCPSYSDNFIIFAKKTHGGQLSEHHDALFDLEKKLNIKFNHLFKRLSRLYTDSQGHLAWG